MDWMDVEIICPVLLLLAGAFIIACNMLNSNMGSCVIAIIPGFTRILDTERAALLCLFFNNLGRRCSWRRHAFWHLDHLVIRYERNPEWPRRPFQLLFRP